VVMGLMGGPLYPPWTTCYDHLPVWAEVHEPGQAVDAVVVVSIKSGGVAGVGIGVEDGGVVVIEIGIGVGAPVDAKPQVGFDIFHQWSWS